MIPTRSLYNGLVVPAARLALPVARRLSAKVERGLEGRRGLLERWEGAAGRTAGRSPRVWVHAASAGEALQARPLVEAVRRERPDAALFFSFLSPSAERTVAGWEAPDRADYLPLDLPDRTRRLYGLLAPDAVVLVGAETWPNLVWTAADRGVPVAQACCRFGEGTGRLRWPVRIWTADLYRRMRAVGAVAEADRETLLGLGVPPDAAAVTGDTRVDVTLARADAPGPPAWSPPEGRRPVIVAGSTWPPDEAVVLPAVARLRARRPGLVALVAPHEPTGEALGRLEARAAELGLATARLGALEPEGGEPPPVVLVDRVGVLYRLYAGADLAYVGGGFDGAVHNTMEPAAAGAPVAVGPRHGGPAEVAALERAGGLAVVADADALTAVWEAWLHGGGLAGRAAREALEGLAGATDRTLGFLRGRGLPV